MARNTGDQQRDQSTRRNSTPANAAPANATRRDSSPSPTPTPDRAANAERGKQSASAGRDDQERSIQTNREAPRREPSRQYGLSAGASSSPFTAMRHMAEDMERLFDAFGVGRSALGMGQAFASPLDSVMDREVWREPSSMSQASWSPHVEMLRRGDQLVVRADLPGVKKDDVHVEVENGVLTISGERKDSHEERHDDFYRSECSYGRFYRSFALPEGVSGDQCQASFNDGVLEVALSAPKQQERSRRIPIR